MSADTKMYPVVHAVICGPELIIQRCSICEAAHIHGHVSDEKVGTYTQRVPHCEDKRGYGLYYISVETIVNPSDRKKLLKRFGKPVKNMQEPGLMRFNGGGL